MVVDLEEDPPGLQPPVQRLVTRANSPLHCLVLRWIRGVRGTLNFVGVSLVSLVRLDPLAGVEEIGENLAKYAYIGILTSRIGALDPHQVPPQNAHPQLIPEGGLAHKLVGCEGIPLHRDPLLGDLEVRPIDRHKTIIKDVPFFRFSKSICGVWGWRHRGGEGQCEDAR